MRKNDSLLNNFRLKVLTQYVQDTLGCEAFELVPLITGFNRRTFLVKCDNGEQYILQVSGGLKVTRNNLGTAFNKVLYDRGGFAPEVISGPDPLDQLSASACIFAYLPGVHRDTLNQEEASKLGTFLGRMHQSVAEVTDLDFDESDAVSYNLTRRACYFIFKDFMLRSIGFFRFLFATGKLKTVLACLRSRSRWDRLSSKLSSSFPSGYNHGDLNGQNILFSENGGAVSGFIDFEMVAFRPFIFDVSEVLCLVVLKGEGDQIVNLSNVNAFLDGYRVERSLTEEELDKLPELVAFRCHLIIQQALICWARGETTELSKQLQYTQELSAGLHDLKFSSSGV